MNFDEFKGYSQLLDDLDANLKSKLCTIVFSMRDGNLTVCAITKIKSVFQTLCKDIVLPEITETGMDRWAVDLESLYEENIRIYYAFPKSDNMMVGLYVDRSGNVTQKKVYKLDKYASDDTIEIDRYDSNMNIISREKEFRCAEKDWTGPKELVTIARNNNYGFSFSKKPEKNQSYMIVHNRNV